MPDRVERIVDEALHAFESSLSTRASGKESLDTLLPAARDDSALPYRQRRPLSKFQHGGPAFVRLWTSFDWAYEFRHCKRLSVADLEVPPDRLRKLADAFTKAAHDHERAAVFSQLKAQVRSQGQLNEATLKAAVTDLGGGTCRFIGSSPVADAAVKSGELEDVIKYPDGSPAGTVGMVVRLDEGPVVRRLVDGLTMSWTRLSRDAVELEVSERFFLDHAGRIRWFDSLPPPPPGTPSGAPAAGPSTP